MQVRCIERVQEIPHDGPFCDLMWSDPEDIEAWAVSPRGAGWLFGGKVTAEFNSINGLDLVCRAHQLVQVSQLNLNGSIRTTCSTVAAANHICLQKALEGHSLVWTCHPLQVEMKYSGSLQHCWRFAVSISSENFVHHCLDSSS